ncbi:MAG TPA: hypothetical protein G4N95_01285 [Anaerolineae bacterium]|nr:hypothetical protein [Anaerolineae bacterium]
MRRGKIFFYLALILILLLVGAFVVYQRFFNVPAQTENQLEAQATPVVDLVDVIVVTQAIPRGGLIDETVLGTIPIPRDVVIQGMFTDMAQVVGRQAKFDLDSGIPLTSSMLVDSAEQLSRAGSIAALQIPKGKVAVSIPINRLSSVSYAPRPGDHVSVIATFLFVDIDSEYQSELPNQVGSVLAPGGGVVIGAGTGDQGETGFQDTDTISNITARVFGGGIFAIQGRTELDPIINELMYIMPSEKQRPRLVSQTLLHDVVVLQIGNFLTQEEEALAKEEKNKPTEPEIPEQGQSQEGPQPTPEPEKPKPPEVITLIVSPQDAVTLNYLVSSGSKLTLALRAAGDDTTFDTEAATLQFLLDTYNIPVPAKLPYGFTPRIDKTLNNPMLENDEVPVETK